MWGKLCIARTIHAVPVRTVCIAGYLFLLCVGSFALICGAQPYNAQPPLKPDPPPSQSGPSPDRASSESQVSVGALRDEELEVARQLIRDYPNDANPIGFLGNVYSKQGLNKEALRIGSRRCGSIRIAP